MKSLTKTTIMEVNYTGLYKVWTHTHAVTKDRPNLRIDHLALYAKHYMSAQCIRYKYME